jgi:hypothetical protein
MDNAVRAGRQAAIVDFRTPLLPNGDFWRFGFRRR